MNEELFRQIPQVNDLLASPGVAGLTGLYGRGELVAGLRAATDAVRTGLRNGDSLPDFDSADFANDVEAAILGARQTNLRPLINGTGVVIHTNLGRAPLAPLALQAMQVAAQGYSNIEFDLESGRRGSRYDHIRELLCRLTGAEDAIVVNNCAAAVTLTMATFAKNKDVIVSRGELVEIGGSFRVPDVIAQNGARLVEVGTTNKTHMADYERALSDDTAIILRTHTSNYRLVGFTAKPALETLADFAHEHDLLLVEDLGSGTLVDLAKAGIGDEPTVGESITAGADIVTFSGDKLLGGPQAGIIVGKANLIAEMLKNPLLRAMRIDKLSLAALEATLRLYEAPFDPMADVPVLAMLTAGSDELREKAERLVGLLDDIDGVSTEVVVLDGEAGGGSLPGITLSSFGVAIVWGNHKPEAMIEALRNAPPAVIGRIVRNQMVLDVRTLVPGDEERLCVTMGQLAGA